MLIVIQYCVLDSTKLINRIETDHYSVPSNFTGLHTRMYSLPLCDEKKNASLEGDKEWLEQ